MRKFRDLPNGLRVEVNTYIPGQEYEFATVAAIDARIAHLAFLLGKMGYGPYTGPGAQDLATEYDMLRFQWRGNALIRERGSC